MSILVSLEIAYHVKFSVIRKPTNNKILGTDFFRTKTKVYISDDIVNLQLFVLIID